jgi:ABC-type transport system involved in multi-copper enzyme maturation permease subunit
MPSVFWIGVGFAAVIFFVSLIISARSRSGSLGTGAAIGLFMGFMLAFPLIALGLATS